MLASLAGYPPDPVVVHVIHRVGGPSDVPLTKSCSVIDCRIKAGWRS